MKVKRWGRSEACLHQAPDSGPCGRSITHSKEHWCVCVCVCVCVRRVSMYSLPVWSRTSGRVRHEKRYRITIFCSTLPLTAAPASLAAVCQLGPIHRWMVAWQLGPCSANQGRMQQEFSPWHIKERDWVLLWFNWFCFGVIHFKGSADSGPFCWLSDWVRRTKLCEQGPLWGNFQESAPLRASLQPTWMNPRETAPIMSWQAERKCCEIPPLLFSPDGCETRTWAARLSINNVMRSSRGKERQRAKHPCSIHLWLMVINKRLRLFAPHNAPVDNRPCR